MMRSASLASVGLVASVVMFSVFTGCISETPGELEVEQTEDELSLCQWFGVCSLPPAPDHLRFFGYYFGGDYVDETAGHSNLAWIYGNEENRLQRARELGMTPVVDVSRYFLDGNLRLRADFREQWAAFQERIRPWADMGIVYYPQDEPYYRRAEAHARELGGVQFYTEAMRTEDIRVMAAELEIINRTIKETTGGAATAVIWDIPTLDRPDFTLPAGFDFVAFDCYGSWDDCSAAGDVEATTHRLRSLMSPGQRMFLVPDAYYVDSTITVAKQNGLVRRAQQYYELAVRTPDIVAIVPFIWQSFDEHEPDGSLKYRYVGARELGSSLRSMDVKGMNERIGRQVLRR